MDIRLEQSTIQLGRDVIETAAPGFTPLVDPHPWAGGVASTNAPVLSSSLTHTATNYVAMTSYQITADQSLTSYGATNLPIYNIALNTNAGTITSTGPSNNAAGNTQYTVTVGIRGTNANGGAAGSNLVITVKVLPLSTLTSSTNLSGFQNSAFTYTITGNNYATSYGASGLPGGLSVNSSSGLISGTPTSVGTNSITLTTINGAGSSNKTATIGIAAAPASGSYYVATTGSDSTGTGAIGSPWATLEYASAHVVGGSTIYVRGGTYGEVFDIYGPNGTNDAIRTTIINYPGEAPVFDHNNPSSSGNSLNSLNWFTISGLTIREYQAGLYVWAGCSNVIVSNMVVHTTGQEGIHVEQDSRDILLVNNYVHDTGQDGVYGEGIYVGQGDNPGVTDNTHNVIVRSNHVYNTLGEGIEIKGGTYACTVESNLLHTINKTGVTSGLGGGAIEINQNGSENFWNADPAHIVRANWVYDTPIGIRMGNGGRCYNNVVHTVTGNGILINDSAGDGYAQYVHNNTVNASTSIAVIRSSGGASFLNNIGPVTANNLAYSSAFFVNAAAHNYHLLTGAQPIDSGVNVSSILTTDYEGVSRPKNIAFDMGAYEYQSTATVSPPANVRVRLRGQ